MKIVLVALLPLALGTSVAMAEMYTWKDARGTSYYTNSLHEIPARYLKRARVLDVATGKKGGPATAHPGTPGGTAPVAGQAPASQPQPAPMPTAGAPAVAAPAQPVAESAPARPQQPLTASQRRARRSAANHRNEGD